MIMRELPPEDQRGIVFYEHEDELPPQRSGMAMSSRWSTTARRIRLPADPARWTEAEITEACDTLAKVPPENLPRVIQGPLLAVSDRSRRVCGLVRSDGMGTALLLVLSAQALGSGTGDDSGQHRLPASSARAGRPGPASHQEAGEGPWPCSASPTVGGRVQPRVGAERAGRMEAARPPEKTTQANRFRSVTICFPRRKIESIRQRHTLSNSPGRPCVSGARREPPMAATSLVSQGRIHGARCSLSRPTGTGGSPAACGPSSARQRSWT